MPRPDDIISGGAGERIERQLSELTQAVHRLVLIDERQMTQSRRQDEHDDRLAELEAEVRRIDATYRRGRDIGVGLWVASMGLIWLMERGFIGLGAR